MIIMVQEDTFADTHSGIKSFDNALLFLELSLLPIKQGTNLSKTVSVCSINRRRWIPRISSVRQYIFVLISTLKYDSFLKSSVGYCLLVISGNCWCKNVSGVYQFGNFILCPEFAFCSFEEVHKILTERKHSLIHLLKKIIVSVFAVVGYLF